MKVLLLLSLLFFSPSQLLPQSGLNHKIKTGLEYSFNFKFDKAESVYNEIIVKYPDYPHGYHYKSQIILWKFLGSRNDSLFNEFFILSDTALVKGEKLLDSTAYNAGLNFILGSIHSLRATASTAKGYSIDGFWETKSSIDYLNKSLEIDSNYYDAYLKLGIIEYALSFIPGVFKWAVNIAGLQADKQVGLEHIRKAYEKGKLLNDEAAFYLAKIYDEYLAEYGKSVSLLESLIKEYPGNILLKYQLGLTHLKSDNYNKAEKLFKQIIGSPRRFFDQTLAMSYFNLGEIEFARNNFEIADSNYRNFMLNTTILDYTGFAHYKKALCNLFSGNDDLFRKNLLLARSGNQDIPEDNYAREKSLFLFDYKNLDLVRSLVKAENYISLGKINQANDTLISILSDSLDEYGACYANFLNALLYNKKGDWHRVIEFAQKSSTSECRHENWIIPYSQYLIAYSFFKLNDFDSALEYIEPVEEYNGTYLKRYIFSKTKNLENKIK